MSKGWDTATLKKLKALTGKGLSTAEIGKRLDMSKNAIVGKLNRLGWNPKAGGVSMAPAASKPATVSKKVATPVKPAKKTSAPAQVKKTTAANPVKKAAPIKPAAKTAEKLVAAAPTPAKPVQKSKSSDKSLAANQRSIQHSLGMSNLRNDQCRWPLGDPDSDSFHFCGEKIFLGKPYCYEHCKQAYQFTATKKKQ